MSVEQPSESALRRALRRARDGAALDTGEAAVLMAARGEQLTELMGLAVGVRDAGLVQAGRPGVITYSRKVFIPLTRLCRDRCHYCTFATVPHRVASAYLEIDEVVAIAEQGAALGCKEALFTLGDRPEERWTAARDWLDERGYDSTLDYVRAAAIAVLERTGLLPHLNPGVMSWTELQRLKPVAPSMGMMLETTARRLFTEPGGPHYGSPDKDPEVRLRVLTDAGRLNIPFTTGILVGIGENRLERAESLFAIRGSARQFGAIQEVIVQNFRAKDDTAMRNDPDLDLEEYLATLAVSRLVLGPKLRLQAPPNLVDITECLLLLDAGVDDFGGISPLTPDHVNPERPWPELDKLSRLLADRGLSLTERLTVHPSYVRAETPWLDPRVLPHVRALADRTSGLAALGDRGTPLRPSGLAWQEPDSEWVSSGRIDLNTAVDTEGRSADRRSDFDEVYGDWDALRDKVFTPGASALASEVSAALRAAERDPAGLSDEQALTLMMADGDGLRALAALADELRRDAVGDDVTYIVNRNINFTNICYTGCRFCAFAQRATDADAFTLSTDEIAHRVIEAAADGATEICMQGGIDPKLPASAYFDLARAVKAAVPGMHLHAFSPMEVVNGASRANLSIEEFLIGLKEAGVGSLPGTAAEILDDEVRWVLTKGKLPTSAWIEVVTTAHRIGLPTTSTMMYGHVDHPRHWVAHLKLLARLQSESGGFSEFVLLPFVHQQAPIYLAGLARAGASQRETKAVHAMARILLHGRIRNIQTSWVKLGDEGVVDMLGSGVNDLGGTLMEETISRMAGSENGSRKSVEDLHALAARAGRPARQRTTLYDLV
ncbi:bifunctional FO biosynthesis protein CofGH [Jatrophihabitans telluris]|uniref:FO synthase n=1 Tax=Jatrophihabitans telluris TaxID=2038343 RepID=A0ABY4QXB0_9ACTN|nr:bifunctional FO biosynthesis protein CofGH [Jatrophihabitans telluris]UQX87540.1 bifunctional FO biosynthesis protein CofGH [Jatrophihabitans telluris]